MSAIAKTTLEELLKHLGFEATVEELPSDDGILLNVTTADSVALIGRAGQSLADLQSLLNRLVLQKDSTIPRVTVDVGGFRQQNALALVQKAKEGAERVRRFGDVVELEPMNSYDRRVVHQSLKDDPDIESHSVEIEGSAKKVIILRPKSAA